MATVSVWKRGRNWGTDGRMRCLVIDVDKGAVDVGQALDLVLELLADVVRLPERRLGVHGDVHLDKVVWPALKEGRESAERRERQTRT
jgi:hypothetical protein